MPVSQQKPQLSPQLSSSYKNETKTLSQAVPRAHFTKSRLVVICSRGNDSTTVKNMDMVTESRKTASG